MLQYSHITVLLGTVVGFLATIVSIDCCCWWWQINNQRPTPILSQPFKGVTFCHSFCSNWFTVEKEWQILRVLVPMQKGIEVVGRSGLHPSHRGLNECKIGIYLWSLAFARVVQIQDWHFIREIWGHLLGSSSFYFIAFATSTPTHLY
jgi:hypothetical protein